MCMEIDFIDKHTIRLDKKLNNLDRFVIDFTNLLEKHKINYVIISGYVPILFGRTRITEDVDIFVEHMDESKIKGFLEIVEGEYQILNVSSGKAFEMLKENIAIRVSRQGEILPNFEIKFTKTKFGEHALKNRLKVLISDEHVFISPIELQIAFKLYLGKSDLSGRNKDIEDAYHIYKLLKEKINIEELKMFIKELEIENVGRKIFADLYERD